jgi:hypothetical protein
LTEHFPDEKAELTHVTKIIEQLADLDPDGQAFRYAAGRDGRTTLADVDKINLVASHEALIGVANYLDAAETGVGEYLSIKREMHSYYSAEFEPEW